MSLRRKHRPEIYFELNGYKLVTKSRSGSSRLWLTNNTPILVKPHNPHILQLGLFVTAPQEYALFLAGKTDRPVTCHLGLIDPGFTGELKLIINNNTAYNQTVMPGELQVYLMAFSFSSPMLLDNDLLSKPRYAEDAGYDLHSPRTFMIYPLSFFTLYVPNKCPVPTKFFVPVVIGRSGMAANGVTVNAVKWDKKRLKIRMFNHTGETVAFPTGSRICQVTFVHTRHIHSSYRQFFNYYPIGDKILFQWSDVSFIDVNRDPMQSIECLRYSAHRVNNCETMGKELRNTKGLGSSGI